MIMTAIAILIPVYYIWRIYAASRGRAAHSIWTPIVFLLLHNFGPLVWLWNRRGRIAIRIDSRSASVIVAVARASRVDHSRNGEYRSPPRG